jgi:hypothetical protein
MYLDTKRTDRVTYRLRGHKSFPIIQCNRPMDLKNVVINQYYRKLVQDDVGVRFSLVLLTLYLP